jgi:hypothetical protein
VKVSDPTDSDSKLVSGGDFDDYLYINWFSGAVVGGFNLEVEITDLNGNVHRQSKHLDSFFEWARGVVDKVWDFTGAYYFCYQFEPFPKYWQGFDRLCAVYSCLEVAHYYFLTNENTGTVQTNSRDPHDVTEGMHDRDISNYLATVGLLDRTTESPTYEEVKDEIWNQKDPIVATFDDYYLTEGDHAVVIIGYLFVPPDKAYCIVVDTNFKTSYLVDWSYLYWKRKTFFYVNGRGWLDPP